MSRRREVSDYDEMLEELQHPSFYGKFCTEEYKRCWEREFHLRACLYNLQDPEDLAYRHVMVAYDYAVSCLLHAYRAFEVKFWIQWKIDARKEMEEMERTGHVNPPRPRSE